MRKNKKNLQGFTLIELLVVISVLSLLASVLLVGFKDIRIRARNDKRNADVQQLAKALNLGLSNVGSSLPDSSGAYLNSGWVCISTSCTGGWAPYYNTSTVDNYLAQFTAKATDPSDNGFRGYGGYLYNSAWSGTGYDGQNYPTSTYLLYLAEPPSTQASCGSARLYWINPGIYAECMVPVN